MHCRTASYGSGTSVSLLTAAVPDLYRCVFDYCARRRPPPRSARFRVSCGLVRAVAAPCALSSASVPFRLAFDLHHALPQTCHVAIFDISHRWPLADSTREVCVDCLGRSLTRVRQSQLQHWRPRQPTSYTAVFPPPRHSKPIAPVFQNASFKCLYRKRSGRLSSTLPQAPSPDRLRYSASTSSTSRSCSVRARPRATLPGLWPSSTRDVVVRGIDITLRQPKARSRPLDLAQTFAKRIGRLMGEKRLAGAAGCVRRKGESEGRRSIELGECGLRTSCA